MCLLIVLAGTHPEAPLVVGANRDELLERAAIPMTVLRDTAPRILGGRDELAGGTWLAVNEAGVVAGLTNRPSAGQRDPSKRSRGELPLLLASYTSAAAAVEAIAEEVRPSEYNPAWILVGDREALFAIDVTRDDAPVVQPLPPGVYVLENRPLGAASPKVDRVRRMLDGVHSLTGDALEKRFRAVLSDHEVPPGDSAATEAGMAEIPPEVKAACVHTEIYGTRWSGIVTVRSDRQRPPTVRYTEGAPCTAGYRAARW